MVKKVGLSAFLVLCYAGLSTAQTLDFEQLECPGATIQNDGNQVDEDGFSITKAPGEPFQFANFCTGERRYPGSTALFNNTVNGLIKVTKQDGGAFTPTEIKAVSLNSAAAVPLNFVGTKQGGGQVNFNVTTDGRGPEGGLETFTFPDTFTDLVSLEWRQEAPFHQFDDLVLGGGGGDTCNYRLKKVKAKKGCDACPSVGDDFPTDTPCENVKDCDKKIKTTIACPNGPGKCKLKGKRSSCG